MVNFAKVSCRISEKCLDWRENDAERRLPERDGESIAKTNDHVQIRGKVVYILIKIAIFSDYPRFW